VNTAQDVSRLATYRCRKCFGERPYGASGDKDALFLLLNCKTCGNPTRHEFRVVNEYDVTMTYDADKITAVKFGRHTRTA
jgi:hypothetical protein